MVCFTKPEIDFSSRENYKYVRIDSYEQIEFNLLCDSALPGIEYWFEIGIDLLKSAIRFTCKILKNGIQIKSHLSGVTQALMTYATNIFPLYRVRDDALKVNPVDGTVKYSSWNFLSRAALLDKLSSPGYFCGELAAKLRQMEQILNMSVLGKILEIYNELDYSHILPNADDSNKSLNPLFDENEVKRIRKI